MELGSICSNLACTGKVFTTTAQLDSHYIKKKCVGQPSLPHGQLKLPQNFQKWITTQNQLNESD